MNNKTLRELTNELIIRDEHIKLLAQLNDLAPVSILVHDYNGNFLYANQRCCDMHGYTKDEFMNLTLRDLDTPEYVAKIDERLTQVKFEGEALFDVDHYKKDGSILSLSILVKATQWGDQNVLLSLGRDISHAKQIDKYKDMSKETLRALNQTGNFDEAINDVIRILKEGTKIDSVGIRFQEGEDYPYFAQDGFSKEFLQVENSLVSLPGKGLCRDEEGNLILECTCGMVLKTGETFWTNDAEPILDIPTTEDKRVNPRNTCIHHGYRSIALIPIKSNNKTVGLMQFNHKTKEYFNPDLIDILEGVAKDIGTALMRKQANRDLHIVNSVLTSVLESTTDGILVVGLDEKVITYSKSFLELWGIPSELMAKRDDVSLLDFVLDQLVDPKAFMERVTQLYASQDVASDEIIFKDGRVFDRFSQPYISCGIIKGRVWSFRNITKRIRAIREKTKLTKILLDSLPCVAILVNCTTREILALNDRAAKEGCEVGKTCYGSWPKLEEPCSYCLAPEACKDNVDKHIIIKEGEIIWDVYWLPVDNELVVHYALDITDIMRAEEVLNKVKANLLISAVKLEGKKILSIDDNPTYVESVKATVERFLPECIFISALNGKDGIELAIKENPDVILLDVKMPGLDGFQVCDVLKTNEQTKSIPIVFLTGVHTDPESRLKAVACGAEALYPKPLLGPDLVSIVKTMSKIKQLQT